MNPWRERLARWLTPLARSCPLSPDAVTVSALALNLIAAAMLLFGIRYPWLFLAAIVVITIAGLADALDGVLARLRHQETRFGDFLDHVCDRISDTALAAGWMIGNGVREPLVVVTLISVMLNGYLGTQIEATFGERNYDSVGRGEFVLALVVFPIVSFILVSGGWNALQFGGATVAEWLSIGLIAFGLVGIVQRFAIARRMGRL